MIRMHQDDHLNRKTPYSHPLIQRAVKHLGGIGAMREDKKPAVLMGQFKQVYADLVAKHHGGC